MGLQLADAVASGFFNGLEKDHYGNTEPRYARNFNTILYRHAGRTQGYGPKLLPPGIKGSLQKEPVLDWLKELE